MPAGIRLGLSSSLAITPFLPRRRLVSGFSLQGGLFWVSLGDAWPSGSLWTKERWLDGNAGRHVQQGIGYKRSKSLGHTSLDGAVTSASARPRGCSRTWKRGSAEDRARIFGGSGGTGTTASRNKAIPGPILLRRNPMPRPLRSGILAPPFSCCPGGQENDHGQRQSDWKDDIYQCHPHSNEQSPNEI